MAGARHCGRRTRQPRHASIAEFEQVGSSRPQGTGNGPAQVAGQRCGVIVLSHDLVHVPLGSGFCAEPCRAWVSQSAGVYLIDGLEEMESTVGHTAPNQKLHGNFPHGICLLFRVQRCATRTHLTEEAPCRDGVGRPVWLCECHGAASVNTWWGEEATPIKGSYSRLGHHSCCGCEDSSSGRGAS